MKSVLISIRPWWCLLIAQGKKTVEVRKTIPKLKPPFKVYIYCTNTKPFLVWGDVFRGNWETEFTNISGYSRERAEKIWDLFNGKVLGEFVCDHIFDVVEDFNIHDELPGSPKESWLTWENAPDEYDSQEAIEKATCLSLDEISAYMGASDRCYCWHISKLQIYDDPKPLSEFVVEGDCDCLNCKKCTWFDKGNGFNVEDDCNLAYQNIHRKEPLKPLFRPPQSWCYVEEVSDGS